MELAFFGKGIPVVVVGQDFHGADSLLYAFKQRWLYKCQYYVLT